MDDAKKVRIREGDNIENDWSQAAYDSWCRELDAGYSVVPGVKAVDLYGVIRSVIEKELSSCEREVILQHYYDQLPVSQIARQTGTGVTNIYNTLARAQNKIERVLRHLVYYDDYHFEKKE